MAGDIAFIANTGLVRSRGGCQTIPMAEHLLVL